MAPEHHPPPEQEKARYETHNNDVNDPGYREFVKPLVDEILDNFNKDKSGLDFGAGTGPVASKMLGEEGYRVELYDPFFINDATKLKTKYDFIICCEVMEHFHDPAAEFRFLRSLLTPGGSLVCMTQLFTEAVDFSRWRYKDDDTHVFFYHPRSIECIRSEYLFTEADISGRVIHFRTR